MVFFDNGNKLKLRILTDANYNNSSHVIILDISIHFSFPICYAAEFSPLVINAEEGVPLEHLITCVQGVRVGISRDGFKTVCWSQTRPQESDGGPGKIRLTVLVFLLVRVELMFMCLVQV